MSNFGTLSLERASSGAISGNKLFVTAVERNGSQPKDPLCLKASPNYEVDTQRDFESFSGLNESKNFSNRYNCRRPYPVVEGS